ncbi:hypothetical protein IE81DRAFT_290667 [Ceraceosorus guamensis]|uniref:Alpha/beta-hydrolase n=1 Tax=Ceraceosorus guamensis TaxID=1522189 RepID=A0A316VXR7_9BASI|nr:hypothetical protein IE81DRAFT_290667 [Ceraceosorus guamensis]PWN42249.1 hypothetical protein IE81DRAFT_290667 [Ceraceosorus guamensis]
MSSSAPPPSGGSSAGSSRVSAAKVDASHLVQTKLKVPHKFTPQSLDVTGILAQHVKFQQLPPPTDPSYASRKAGLRKRPLALLLHGVLAHKDQTYHKGLVARLPIDSFRFDFRSNHETPPTGGDGGGWGMAKFDEDLDDMRSVILHLRERYNYHVHLLIGHSRGALDGFAYYSKWAEAMRQDPEERIPYYVSLSARWRMHVNRDNVYLPAFAKEGIYRWNVRVAGKDVEVQIRPQDVEQFANFPIADHVRRFPLDSDALLIHGTSDTTVPTADVAYYVNEL